MDISKLNKGQILALILLDLQKGPLIRSEILTKYNVSDRTLRRYISDLRGIGMCVKRTGFGNPVIYNNNKVEYTDSYFTLEVK